MKTKGRLLSLILAFLMFASVLSVLPPLEVGAASDFSITSPSDGRTLASGTMLKITWTSYSGADHYWLTVKNTDTGKTEINCALSETSYSLMLSASGAEYKIYAAAMDANDNVLDTGSAWDAIYVYTKDEDTFDVSKDYFEFEADGGSDNVCVYASSSYTLSESLTWITLSSTSGSSDQWITITCKANTSTSGRDGTITVTHKASGEKIYIDVYQEGEIPEIAVSEDYLDFNASGGTDTFEVYAEDAYTISESLSWISLSATSGSSDMTITVTCNENTSSSSREGTITVKQTSTGEKITIDVYQEGVTEPEPKAPEVDLSVSPSRIELGESFTYEGTAYGNDYKINTVSVGIAYFRSESDYQKYMSDNEAYASLCADSVYIRYTGLNATSKTVEKTIKTGAGGTVEGYILDSNNQYVPYEMSVANEGVYLISLNAWSDAYGTLVKDRVAVYVTEPEPEPKAPEVDLSVSPSRIELGESFTYEGTAYGNDYKINTVSVGIAYFRSESDYQKYMSDNEAYASLCADSVYIRYTGLNATSKTVEKTIKTGAGGTVEGYILDSNNQYVPYEMSVANEGVYLISLNAWSDAYGTLVKDRVAVVVIKNEAGTVGDINGDGQITNKDRFWLKRYLANMAGYTNINKTMADINGDGVVNSDDAIILERHLFGWIGYENLEIFHNTDTGASTEVPKWDMSFSSNAVTIELVLKEGSLDASKNYLFIAENSKGLHYTGIIEAGKTSASFSVKAMQMPRGEMYSYYIIPEGVVLAGNKDTYCIGKSVVPLFNGNMITSVKSADRTVAKNGYVFIGDGLTINWDGSYGVDNFKLVVTLNGVEIYNKTFNHDGPGTVTISADKISAQGAGTLIVSGYVEPSAASGLATAVSVWTGSVVASPETANSNINPVDLLNEDALALYNKNENVAYLQLDTYYYWQAFSDELESGRYWESYRADISNIVNGLFSSPTTLICDSSAKALIKQAVKTRLLEIIESEDELKADIVNDVENTMNGVGDALTVKGKVDALLGLSPLCKAGGTLSDSELLEIIKKVDLRSFNGADISDYKKIFEGMTVFYNGNPYKIADVFNVADEGTAVALKELIKTTKNAKSADQLQHISNIKQMQVIDTAKFKSAFKLDAWDGVELAANAIVFATDMYSLYYLNEKFDQIEQELYEIEGGSSGVFKEAISEVINELKKEYFEQFIGEFMIFATKTGTNLIYGKIVSFLAKKNPYVFLAVVSNGLMTCLANTNAVNKGMLTLPHIVDAMNQTVSEIEYTYALFMMSPSNELYYKLRTLFAAYKFQVELGAEVYLNLNMADHNSYLKRFYRFVNPFDKDDEMPQQIQGCYDQDIMKLNYVMNWFGFN